MHHLVGVAEIAEMLGVSRQRVAQIAATYDDFPDPEAELSAGRIWSRTAIETWIALHPERGPGVGSEERARFFGRFAEDARRVIVVAHEEAAAAGVDVVEPEHLLAGVLIAGNAAVREALADMHVDLRRVREAGEPGGGAPPTGEGRGRGIAFSPKAREVLEYAFRAAHRHGGEDQRIGSADLLRALIGGEGVELDHLGLDPPARRQLWRRFGYGDRGAMGTVRSAGAAIEASVGLTYREAEIVRLVRWGASNREIGAELSVPENTVRQHLRNISEKLTLRLQEGRAPRESPALGPRISEALEGIAERLEAIERRLEE